MRRKMWLFTVGLWQFVIYNQCGENKIWPVDQISPAIKAIKIKPPKYNNDSEKEKK